MKVFAFSKRNDLEILRDPLNLVFGVGFPIILLLLLTVIQRNIPVALFEIEHLAPGIVVFGLSFMTLFSATLIAKDRGSSFLQRLYTTPLTAGDFILGYFLPILPICIAQSVICYAAAVILGLKVTVHRRGDGAGRATRRLCGGVPAYLVGNRLRRRRDIHSGVRVFAADGETVSQTIKRNFADGVPPSREGEQCFGKQHELGTLCAATAG